MIALAVRNAVSTLGEASVETSCTTIARIQKVKPAGVITPAPDHTQWPVDDTREGCPADVDGLP